jgi:UDP-2,4-diacetamido-2,4,6-trideoxy-beta-L-altropyranose hydrolase
MEIFFRVDSSQKMGTGHVMRCITLANRLRKKGCKCTFICRLHEGNITDRISAEKYKLHGLKTRSKITEKIPQNSKLVHADWLQVSQEVDARDTKKILQKKKCDWLIVDHYAIDHKWERLLKPYTQKLMVIDDLADRYHECDLILDQNLIKNYNFRYHELIQKTTKILLGPEFALLQPQYSQLRPKVKPRTNKINRVFVFFGGADNFNLTKKTIKALCKLNVKNYKIDIVCPKISEDLKFSLEQLKASNDVKTFDTVDSLAPFIASADLAIGAGGATTWERLCLGLPSLIITLAENQKPVAKELDRLNLAKWIGHGDVVTSITISECIKYYFSKPKIKAWSENCLKVVDGCGADRVAETIIGFDID